MNENLRKNLKVFSIIITLVFIAIFFVIYNIQGNGELRVSKSLIITMSWVGHVVLAYIIITSRVKFKTAISFYSIFMLFMYLFNYGQCILWSFGVFLENSIIIDNLFNFNAPSMSSVFITQFIVIISMLCIHCGVLLSKDVSKKSVDKTSMSNKSSFYFFAILSIIVIPVVFYKLFKQYQVTAAFGYRALYYGDNINKFNPIINIIEYWFFPCLVGLLLSSNYKAKKIVYIVFAIFVVMNLAMGERGTWFYKLIILAYIIFNNTKKKIKFKNIIIYALIGYLGLYFISAIKELRNIGISIQAISETLKWENNPLVEFIMEMGTTMKTSVVLVEHGWDIYPYGNTYLFALLSVITSKFVSVLGIPYIQISSWFSQTYLGLRYGAGFSLITEALLNFGPYVLPLIMLVFGFIFNKCININKESNTDYRIFKNAIMLNAIIPIVRSTFYYTIKEVFWGVIVLLIMYKFICGKKEKNIE